MATRPPTKGRPTSTARRRAGSTYETVRLHGLRLPGVEEGTSYGTPALKVRGKLLTRLWEDGDTLVLRTTFVERDLLVQAEPATYFFTEHYRDYPWVLVHLSKIRPTALRQRLEDAWRRVASQRLLAQFTQGK